MPERVTTVEGRTVGVVMRWLRAWPDWLLIVAFLALAVIAALAGTLDDWLRAAMAIAFVAIAASLIARLRRERAAVPPTDDTPAP